MTTTLTSQQALRTADFIQTIGVNTHLANSGSVYGNVSRVIQDLDYLNIDHVRDRQIATAFQQPYITVGKAGYKFDLIVGGDPVAAIPSLEAMAPYTYTIEGPNEVDRSPISYGGLSGPAGAVADQKALYTAVHSSQILKNTPVLNFSLAPGTNASVYGDVSAYADYKNVHAYGQYGCPSYYYLTSSVARATDTPNLPAVITETGNYTRLNHDSGVSEVVAAKLIMNTLIEAFRNGVKLTYIYELLDINSSMTDTLDSHHNGLFHTDGTPKVAATAIHNLTTILGDSAPNGQSFATAPLTYAIAGRPSPGGDYLMEKSNGAYDIVMWREPWIWDKASNSEVTFASATVTVTFGKAYHTINVFDPLVGSAPIKTYHDVSSVQVSLNTSALIVEVEPDAAVPVTYTGDAGGVFNVSGVASVIGGAGAATVNVTGAATVLGASGALDVTLAGPGASVTGGTGALSVTDTSRGPNTITGGAGVLSVKSALGGDTITTNNTSGVSSISLGTGSNTVTVNGTTYINADKSNLAVISNGNLSINGGSGALTLTGISGSAYVFTQGGTKNLLNLGSGANTVLSHGADTINASTVAGAASTGVFAASSATITGGAGTLVVNGQAAAITVTGGTGAVKASSMANGSLLKGGSLGGNILSASGGNTTLMGGGGGLLSDTGTTGGNLLMAGSGATTLTAGSGNDTLVGGSGADVFVLTRAAAAHGAVIQNYTAGSDTLSFVGFGSTPAIASQQVSGGNLNLTLADQTHVTLVGVTSPV